MLSLSAAAGATAPNPLSYAVPDDSRRRILNRLRLYVVVSVIFQLITFADNVSVITFNGLWPQYFGSPSDALFSGFYYVLVPSVELILFAALLAPRRIPLAPAAAAQVASVLIAGGIAVTHVLFTGIGYLLLLELPPLLAAVYEFQQAVVSALPPLLIFMLWRKHSYQGDASLALPRVVASACMLYAILPVILPLYAQYGNAPDLFSMDNWLHLALSVERIVELLFGITLIACAAPVLKGHARSRRLLRTCALLLFAGSALHFLLILSYFQFLLRFPLVMLLYVIGGTAGLPFVLAACFALSMRDALALPDLHAKSD
jgi:hypothetical protein